MAITPSDQDLLDAGIAEAQARRPDLAFNDGDVTEAFCHASMAMASAVLSSLLQQVADTYFGLAEGDALDTTIEDKTGITRNDAHAASVTLTIARAGSGSAGTLDIGKTVGTDPDDEGDQIVFELTEAVTVPTTSFSATAAATALNAGKAGNVLAGTLTTWMTAPFDTTITVTNVGLAAGGSDKESDDDYRRRGAAAWITQRRGTLKALEQGALEVTGVASAVATENLDTGIATVSIADQSGGSNPKLIYDVQVNLEDWRAAGSIVTVVGGLPAVIDMSIEITEYTDGFDVATASTAIIASVTRLLNDLRRGEIAYLDAIKAAVIAPYSEFIKKVTFTWIQSTTDSVTTVLSTTSDIDPAGKAIRAGTITVS